MLLDQKLRVWTSVVGNYARFFQEGESEVGKTDRNDAGIPITYLPACLLRNRVSKKWRCVFVWRRSQARVNKVKHLSRVNGNINTPRRLRLETSRANERRTPTPQGWRAAGRKALRTPGDGGGIRGRFLSVEKLESKRFKAVKVDFNFEAVLKVPRATRSLRQTFWSCTYELSLSRTVVETPSTL